MSDEHAHFLIMFADACSGAHLAQLVLDVSLSDGSRIQGVPAPLLEGLNGARGELGAGECTIAGRRFRAAEVIAFEVHSPDPEP